MAMSFESLQQGILTGMSPEILILIVAILIWKLIWYGLAIYTALEKKQKAWFVVLFILAIVLNDLGIVAIIYLIINRKPKIKNKVKKKK
jgi:uncharacterized membrane protein